MVRTVGGSLLAALAATLALATACRDSTTPQPDADLTPPVGTLVVASLTTGSSLDPDGYVVTVDSTRSQSIATTGTATFGGLSEGDHTVALSGVAANCTVSGANPRTVTVVAGVAGATTFTVSCTPAGDLLVSTATTGSNLDPDGYTVTVDGSTSQAIATNDSVTFTRLSAGDHTVALSGVAANCTVSGANPRTVTVPQDGTATTTFSVSCVAPTGDLTVTTSTTGSSLDPDGYTVTVDQSHSQAIATNGSVTFTGLAAGDHSVALSGVAANCTVSGANPQTATVPSGGAASATFAVSCAVRITGLGQIGSGQPVPNSDLQTFDFEARADLTGRLTYTDYTLVHPDGTVATLRVDPTDARTGITALRTSSSACSDPSRGAEFDGIARIDGEGILENFTIVACDNGPPGSGLDFFSMSIPSEKYYRAGSLTGGDIARSAP